MLAPPTSRRSESCYANYNGEKGRDITTPQRKHDNAKQPTGRDLVRKLELVAQLL
jgi:hypothetical protein